MTYLLSLYFDNESEERLQKWIKQIAKYSGNDYIIKNNIPPHITIAMINSDNEEKLCEKADKLFSKLEKGMVEIVSVGTFKTNTIYVLPVLNEYLFNSAKQSEEAFGKEQIEASKYRVYNWVQHITLAKHLTAEEQRTAFEVMQREFVRFEAHIVRAGLSRTEPYRDILVREL